MARTVEHNGVVERTPEGRVFVRITAQSACASCRAKQACGMGEQEEKLFEIVTPEAAEYGAGEAVRIGIGAELGGRAVVLAYVIPCLVLVAALVGMSAAGMGEGAAALSALGATALYYVLLWMQRRRIETKIKITITKI